MLKRLLDIGLFGLATLVLVASALAITTACHPAPVELAWGQTSVRPLDGGASNPSPALAPPPICRPEPIPECGDWLVFDAEGSTSTTARINVARHEAGKIVGYFWGIAPWQVNAQVHGIPCVPKVPGEPCSPPIQTWVIENLGPGIEWTFRLSEVGTPQRCPKVLACSGVSFELSPFERPR